MSDRRFALGACVALGVGLLGCSRGQQESDVNPLPEVGFSETVAVGNRGTQAAGAFDAPGPAAAAARQPAEPAAGSAAPEPAEPQPPAPESPQ